MNGSTSARIMRRLQRQGRGFVFTPADFLDVGQRASVDQALSRLARRKKIRRLSRGVYDYPRTSPTLGALSPTSDAVAQALARQTQSVIQVGPAQAANLMGVSTQVPAQAIYLTDGPSRKVQIGRRSIALRHASPRTLVAAGTNAGTIVQAIRYLGKHADVGPLAQRLSQQLTSDDRDTLVQQTNRAPSWMQPVLSQIAHTG
jgi:hypothetical protein